ASGFSTTTTSEYAIGPRRLPVPEGRRPGGRSATIGAMKIASWNVNSLNVRLPHVERWCEAAGPDVLALQETKLEDAKFPVDALARAGFHAAFSGQKTYNGVAILARQPLTDVVHGVDGYEDPQRRVLSATVGDVRVVNLYVVNGQAVGSE